MLDPRKDRYKYFVIDVCEGLHGYICGSGDDFIPDYDELFEFLQMRLDTWEPTIGKNTKLGVQFEKYDETIKNLVTTTLDMKGLHPWMQ